MMAKPMKTLKLQYPMIQFLIIYDNQLTFIQKCLALFLRHLSYLQMSLIKDSHVIFCNIVFNSPHQKKTQFTHFSS